MAKKPRGAALRAKKRQQEQLEELQEQQAAQVASQAVVDEPDEQLFVLDTEGGIVPHHEKPPKESAENKKKRTLKLLTAKEKLEVERLLKKYSKQELVKMVQEGKALLDQTRVRTHGPRADGKRKASYDLWEEEEGGNDESKDDKQAKKDKEASSSSSEWKSSLGSAPAGISPGHVQRKPRKALQPPKTAKKPVAVEVAQAGQSYRPDPALHKRALDQARAVETRRLEAEEYKNTPISQGMSEETKALLVGDTDSEEEESDEEGGDDENENEDGGALPKKRKDKLTRAQRNKQKRVRVEKAIQEKARKRRKLENQVAEIPRYKKEFRKESKTMIETKEKIAEAKEASTRVKGSKVFETASESNPIEAPTYPIGLTSEVKKSTLRTIIPKGSLVTDRIMSFRDRDLAADVKGHKKMRRHKRRKAVKGKHNAGIEGDDFAVLG